MLLFKTENDFKSLIEGFFLIKDSGYSCHKLFGRRINEWIICAEKVESYYLKFILQKQNWQQSGNKKKIKIINY